MDREQPGGGERKSERERGTERKKGSERETETRRTNRCNRTGQDTVGTVWAFPWISVAG